MNTIGAAAVLILLVRPLDLFSVGFQLSFAATAAIVLFAKKGEKIMSGKKLNRVSRWIFTTIIISIAAQLGTLPLTMYYFGYVSTYFLLTNLVVLPIVTILVPCGLISIVLGGTIIGVWWTKITYGLSWLMNQSVGWIEALPGSTWPATVSIGMVLIYYVLLIGLCGLMRET